LAEPANRDANELLWVGSIGQHKGIGVLLQAFASVLTTRPGLRLRLVGGERAPGDRAHLEAIAASLGIDARVSFEGWLPRADVARAMSRAAVFVHPSPSETFGVAAAEAILTGLPVAARRSGGVPWIIERSGGFGRVAEADDPDSFARAIAATLDGPLATPPDVARARLVAAVGASAVAHQALAIYQAALAETRPADLDQVHPTPATMEQPALGSLPRVLVATERIQAPGLVASLPADLQDRVVLVVPPATPGVAEPNWTGVTAHVVAADPFVPGAPRPRGRSPLARLRRSLWRPAPTADALLDRAVMTAATGQAPPGQPVAVVAIDAPAAIHIAGLDPRKVRLAPGSLRWLADRWAADRWAADRDRMPPST
jgi:hypothetical protein